MKISRIQKFSLNFRKWKESEGGRWRRWGALRKSHQDDEAENAVLPYLPAELWVFIFELIVKDPASIHEAPYFALSISHVCRGFRVLAVGTATLWSTVVHSEKLRSLDLVITCLKRSEGASLTVVACTHIGSPNTIRAEEGPSTIIDPFDDTYRRQIDFTTFMSAVAPSVDRWEHFYMWYSRKAVVRGARERYGWNTGIDNLPRKLREAILSSGKGRFRSLTLRSRSHSNTSRYDAGVWRESLNAMQVEMLTMHDFTFPVLPSTPLPSYGVLSSLTLITHYRHSMFEIGTFLRFLQACTALYDLTLKLFHPIALDDGIDNVSVACPVRLCTLELHVWHASSPSCEERLFSRLSFPEAEKVVVELHAKDSEPPRSRRPYPQRASDDSCNFSSVERAVFSTQEGNQGRFPLVQWLSISYSANANEGVSHEDDLEWPSRYQISNLNSSKKVTLPIHLLPNLRHLEVHGDALLMDPLVFAHEERCNARGFREGFPSLRTLEFDVNGEWASVKRWARGFIGILDADDSWKEFDWVVLPRGFRGNDPRCVFGLEEFRRWANEEL